MFLQHLGNRTTIDELHHHAVRIRGFKVIEVIHDVHMLKAHHDSGFPLESLGELIVTRESEHFQNNRLVQCGMICFVYGSHSAFGQQHRVLVFADLLPDALG